MIFFSVKKCVDSQSDENEEGNWTMTGTWCCRLNKIQWNQAVCYVAIQYLVRKKNHKQF